MAVIRRCGPAAANRALEALDARLIAEDDLKRPLSSGEVSQYWMRRSWDDIRAAPVDWLRLLAWKWFLTWNARESIDAESIQTHARYSPLLAVLRTVLHFGVICPWQCWESG